MNKAIFWDFDGTLVVSRTLWSRSVWEALREQVEDTGVTVDDIRPLLRTCYPWDVPERDFSSVTGDLWWEYMTRCFIGAYEQLGVSPADAAAAGRQVRQRILRTENYTLYPDAAAVLQDALDAGYRNYVLSNNYPELDAVIRELGIAGYFSGIFVSARIGYDKPRREIFEYALKTAGYPGKRLMVGDNPRADIEGARPFGMTTILVHNAEDSAADYTFENLSEIVRVL